MSKNKKEINIFSDIGEEAIEEKKEISEKSILGAFEVEEKKKPTKKPFSFYLDVTLNQKIEENVDRIQREAKRKGVNIDISKSKLVEKILNDYFSK